MLEGDNVFYEQTFDILDIRGPLGVSTGGVRGFFINILKDLVLGGFVQRRKNGAIMIRVRGTEESLRDIQCALDNANVEGVSWTLNTRWPKKPITEATSRHFKSMLSRGAERGEHSPDQHPLHPQ